MFALFTLFTYSANSACLKSFSVVPNLLVSRLKLLASSTVFLDPKRCRESQLKNTALLRVFVVDTTIRQCVVFLCVGIWDIFFPDPPKAFPKVLLTFFRLTGSTVRSPAAISLGLFKNCQQNIKMKNMHLGAPTLQILQFYMCFSILKEILVQKW